MSHKLEKYKRRVINTIPKEVFIRLALLTVFNDTDKDNRVGKLYLMHIKALIKAELIKGSFHILSKYIKTKKTITKSIT